MNSKKRVLALKKIVRWINLATQSAALIIVSSMFAVALGVSPAGKTVQFEPEKDVILEFFAINSEGNDLEVRLSGSGSLQEHLFFENDVISLNASSYRTAFRAILKLPEELSPGTHLAGIVLTPVFDTGPAGFSAFVSPQATIKVRVPYPDKYVEVSLYSLQVDEGTPIPLSLQFDNLGSLSVTSAGGFMQLISPDKKVVKSIDFPEISVAANSFAKTEASPRPVLKRGEYIAKVRAYYDGSNVELEELLVVGEPLAEVTGLLSKDLVAGEVNRVGFNARLFWNAPVSANPVIIVEGRQEELPVTILQSGDRNTVTWFFDASALEPGEKEMTVRLVYGSQVRDYGFSVVLHEKGALVGAKRTVALALAALAAIVLIIALALAIMTAVKKKAKP